MLKPSGGMFKKLFSPDRMAKTNKRPMAAPKSSAVSKPNRDKGNVLSRRKM